MASSKKSGSTKVYQTIGNHIDQNLTERLKEGVSERGNNTIERIKGELFDVLTVGGDEDSRKEIGKNIKAELEEKLSKKEETIKEKRKSGDIPSKREENEILILKRFIKDVDYRLGHGIPTPDVNDLNRNIYLDLDKNNEFDKDIVKNVVDDIIDSDMDDLKNNILLKRLIESDKYYEEICKEIRKYGKKLYKGLFVEDILDYLKSVKEKNSNSLEKKLLDFKVNGGNALRLREKNDIRQRFNSLEPGDRILLNDGTTIIVISKSKYGNKITFREDRGDYGTQERTENFNEFSGYRCKLGDIKEIIIGLKLPETESKTEPEPEPKPEPKPQPKTEPEPKPKPQPKTEPEPEPKPQPKIEPEPKPKPQPKTEPEPKPKPQPKTEPEENVVFEENAVLSDVSESYEDMISREVENEINDEWHNTARYNVFKKGKLFLMRGKMRKDRIAKKKENYQRTPFTNNGTFNREMAKQAARHDLEENLGGKRDAFGNINREELSLSKEAQKEFKEMCQEYIAEKISQVEFQNRFNQFVQNRLGLPEEQQFVATNILEKLDAIKNDNKLLKSITSELEKYLSDHNNSHFDNIRTQIDNDFKNYRRDPRFRKAILEILGNTAGLTKEQLDEKINKFIKHQKALAKASANNLQIKLDLLTNGKGAYQTNNKDRENWLFRFGNKLDKMPRWGQALTVAGISASGMLVGGAAAALGASAFAAGLAGTATLSGLVGAKNFIKKWTHHTKEQNTYEKNLTRNYEEEIAKMKEWERIRTEKDSEGKYTHGRFARYRAKRQLELYGKTTQAELQNENTGNTKELSNFIYAALERYNTLNPDEKNALNCTLLDAKARLETYWAKGHNFLKSKDKNQIERDFYDLENALALSVDRILGTGANINDIPLIQAYDGGKEVNYQELLEFYKKDYNSATKKFSGERARLATKWGLGTAAVTFGTSAVAQAIAGTGMFAKDAVAGVPGTPESTSTTNTGTVTDNFGMGRYELSGGNKIFQAAQDNISGLNSSDTVTLHLGAGTDGTAIRAGSSLLNHGTYLDKLAQVKDVIAHSSLGNKADLISQLDKGFATSGFTNTDLHGMRCLEAVEETVKGAGNFAGKLNISYDTALDIDGSVAHDAASRMSQAFLEISQFVPGKAGTEAVEGGAKWLVIGLPWFSNTFKRKNDEKPKDKGPKNKGPNDKGPNDDIPPSPSNGGEGKNKGKDNGGNDTPPSGGGKGGKGAGKSVIAIPAGGSDERDEIKDNDTKETTETTDKEKEVSLKKMTDDDRENFNKSDFTERAKDYTKDFKPENILKLPNGEIIYLTDILKGADNNELIGYTVDKDGKMDVRLFYRSNSEGCRRSAPGKDGRRYSKGESLPNGSYETTTKVSFEIGKLLDKLPVSGIDTGGWSAITRGEILLDDIKQATKTEVVMFPKEDLNAVNFYDGKESEEVIEGYKKLTPEGLEYKDMKKVAGKKYSYKHEYLGKVNVEVYRMKYNGRDVDIYFSRAEKVSPNKVRIENIVYSDAKINSFGLYDEQINAGPLVAKPIDYKIQTPKKRDGKPYGYAGFLSEEEGKEYAKYLDIRDLYQENPIIKKYKELAKIKDSE